MGSVLESRVKVIPALGEMGVRGGGSEIQFTRACRKRTRQPGHLMWVQLPPDPLNRFP